MNNSVVLSSCIPINIMAFRKDARERNPFHKPPSCCERRHYHLVRSASSCHLSFTMFPFSNSLALPPLLFSRYVLFVYYVQYDALTGLIVISELLKISGTYIVILRAFERLETVLWTVTALSPLLDHRNTIPLSGTFGRVKRSRLPAVAYTRC